MITHVDISKEDLRSLIDTGKVTFAGNTSLKIYGLLSCNSGRRMKKENRVFFKDEEEAWREGFRPCGSCMRAAYLEWKRRS